MVLEVFGEASSRAKGAKLHTVTALPGDGAAPPPKAVLVWHHGLAEHVGRYKLIFASLADAGIAVYSADAAGHGRSEGDRAVVMRFDDLVEDLAALAQAARADVARRYPGEAPSLPFFLGGHSLGGLVSATLAHRDQGAWAGLLVCSPAMDVEWTAVLRIQAALGGLMAALVPRARLVPAVRPEDMNSDPVCVEEYVKDELNTVGNLPARTGNETLKAMNRLRAMWPQFTLPIYAHHGGADKCTSLSATKAFVEAAASKDKVFHEIPGGFHEVMLGQGCAPQPCVREMADWILQRAASKARM